MLGNDPEEFCHGPLRRPGRHYQATTRTAHTPELGGVGFVTSWVGSCLLYKAVTKDLPRSNLPSRAPTSKALGCLTRNDRYTA